MKGAWKGCGLWTEVVGGRARRSSANAAAAAAGRVGVRLLDEVDLLGAVELLLHRLQDLDDTGAAVTGKANEGVALGLGRGECSQTVSGKENSHTIVK